MGKRIFLMCILMILMFGLQADAGVLTIQPSAPTVEISSRTDLTVSGASGYVTWQAVKGTIQGTGQTVSYIAPMNAGSDSVAVMDTGGNMATITIAVVPKNDKAMPFVRENANWQTYINRNEIRSMTYSDDGKFFWAATNGGIEKRNAQTGELVKVYTRIDGLPSVSVNAVLSDFSGGFWAGTDAGLFHLKADGSRQIFDTGNSVLPNNAVNALLSDGYGGLWIGTGKGLARLKTDNSWEIISSTGSGLPVDTIYTLQSDGKRGLWVGTGGGIAHLKSDGNWENISSTQIGIIVNAVYAIATEPSGGLWAGNGSGSGIAHLKSDGKWEYFDSKNSLLPTEPVRCIQTDINSVWIGTDGGGLAHLNADGSVESWTIENADLPDNHISAFLIAGNDGVWVGTTNGLARVHADGSSELMNQENPTLPGNIVYSIESDDSGGIWIGTDKGLAHCDMTGLWTVYSKSNSKLPNNTVYALISDSSSGVWIGTAAGLAHLKSDKSLEIFTTDNSKIPGNTVYALESDGRKGVWIGAGRMFLTGGGLAHIRSDGSWEIISQSASDPLATTQTNSGLPDNSVRSLYLDSTRGLWIGTEGGGLAYRRSTGVYDLFDKASGLPSNMVLSLFADGLGGMWIGTDNGLAHRSQDGDFEAFDKANSGLPNNTVKTLSADSYSGIWVGTSAGLAYYYANKSWDMFDTKNSGLPNASINALLPDTTGGIWIGTNNGLTHLTFSEKSLLSPAIQDQTVRTYLSSGARAAIIVQPRGSEDDRQNAMFQQMAGYAYKTLKDRGYDNKEIYFLSHRPDVDVSGDGVADYSAADGPVTQADAAAGIKARDITVSDIRAGFDWAVGKGKLDQPLVFIFIGQATGEAFKLSPFGDLMTTSDINSMIDQYQKSLSNKVIAIFESSYSGKLMTKLIGQNRILIASANENPAYYDDMGFISFNNFFFNALHDGKTFYDAFQLASTQLSALKTPFSSQSPQLDDTGDGRFTSGDGSVAKTFCLNSCFDYPLGKVTLEPQGGGSVNLGQSVALSIKAQAAGSVSIQHVWAVVMGPESAKKRDLQGSPITPSPVVNIGTKAAQFDSFQYRGDYVTVFMAKDSRGNVTVSAPIVYALSGGKEISLDPIASQAVYYDGDQCKVTIPPASTGKTRYVRMRMPGVSDLFVFTNLNTAAAFNGRTLPEWKGGETILDIKISSAVPRGEYSIDLIYVPTGIEPLSHPEAWEIGTTTFKIATPPAAAPVPSQAVYHVGDQCKVSLPTLPGGKKQYPVMKIPGSDSLFVFNALNKAVVFDGKTIPEWTGSDMMLDIAISAQVPKGEYSLYLLRLPGTIATPLTRTDLWEVGQSSFKIE